MFVVFQIFKTIGVLDWDKHLPWELDKVETKNFENQASRIYKHYREKIRRQKERGQDVTKAEEKLKVEFLCPEKFQTILGGLVPCPRKAARKRT